MTSMLRVFLAFCLLIATPTCATGESTKGAAIIPQDQELKKKFENDITLRQAAMFFASVARHARENYVEPVTYEELLTGGLEGMLSALDPHSTYLDKKKFNELRNQTQGEFAGLGVEVTMEDGLVRVVSPLDETPASKAGLEPGDLIILIDKKPVFGLSLMEAVDKLKGRRGTEVEVTIRREGKEDFDVTLTRDIIKIVPVKWRVEEDVGYIRIRTFNEETTDEVRKAVRGIKAEISDIIKGVVLDFRNNPGGLFEQATEMADLFIDEGVLVSIKTRHGETAQHIRATPGDILDGIPIAVLINGGSASSSEIVAGALKEHKRGIVLGTRSYGKGSVQTVVPLANNGAIMLTTALYHTPSGISIQKEGITPNIEIKQAVDIKLLDEGERFREEDYDSAIERGKSLQDAKADKKSIKSKQVPGKEGDEEGENDEPVDLQLRRALDVLRGISFYRSGNLKT